MNRDRFAQAESYCGRVTAGFAVAGGIALVVLLGVTVAEVFWRYVLNKSLLWAEDVSTMALVVVGGGGDRVRRTRRLPRLRQPDRTHRGTAHRGPRTPWPGCWGWP